MRAVWSSGEVGDRAQGPALEPLAGERGEEALGGVEPGAGVGVVEGPACITNEPGHDRGVLVSPVIVEDGMNHLADLDLSLDGIEKADEQPS